MIKKLRRKFVAISMVLVAAILAAVFLSIYLVTQRNIEQLSQQVLHRVIQEDIYFPGSDFSPEYGITFGGDKVSLPYFTVHIWKNTAYVTGGTYANLENTELLEDILTRCMEQEQTEGTIGAYHLRYLRQNNGLFEKVAFVDMSMEQATLRNMMASFFVIALAALALLFGVSVLLSHWATRPAEKAWAQQKQFLSDASHELKTPLTVILSNAELLNASGLTDKPARWTDNIHSEATRMKALVEEMLTLARADNMPRATPLTDVLLSDIAYDCALSFEAVAFEAGKHLDYQITDGLLVSGDAERLRQLISILLDNAVKYSSGDGAILLTLQKTDRHAKLIVSNPGKPIPAEQLSRLFERFYRADESRGEQTGFGLGLSIAAAIAQEHHGTLRAESDVVATRFICSIPLKK